MRQLTLALPLLLLACQQPAPELPYVPPPPIEECDLWGDDCLSCCDLGYTCQRGRCIDGSLDLDFDGHAGHWDCDDFEDTTYPGATERCDDEDNNCNGLVDEGVRNERGECAPPCLDADLDGVTTCDNDCDDTDPAVHPEAEELCDGRDNDCDGLSDEGFDQDGDGSGLCEGAGDCDDSNPLRAPGFPEVCDGVDNDCNEAVDDGELCGRAGECQGGACRWTFEMVDGEHETGAAVGGDWCAGPDDPAAILFASVPARGMRDFPAGVYEALLRFKVSGTVSADRCAVLRLHVNDRDGDGTGTCRTCFFGGAETVVIQHFTGANVYRDYVIPFSIGPERLGHLIEVFVERASCREVTVCGDTVVVHDR